MKINNHLKPSNPQTHLIKDSHKKENSYLTETLKEATVKLLKTVSTARLNNKKETSQLLKAYHSYKPLINSNDPFPYNFQNNSMEKETLK